MTTELLDNYKIITKIGEGGMARVYLAQDPQGNQVAIKKLILNDKEPARKLRFEHEINLYKKINSEYVAKFLDGKFNPEPYIVMEYIDGPILKDFIKKHGGRLSYNLAAKLAIQLCTGFGELHANAITHRDIKSSNIIVTKNNKVKIIDFGIAITPDSQRYTSDGKLIGSVHYMAPEILTKEPASEKSDIYSLGILLFEMLAGSVPFNGSNMAQTLSMQKTESLPDLRRYNPEIPIALINIVAKATAKNPAQRYASMYEMRRALQTYLNPDHNFDLKLDPNKPSRRSISMFLQSKWFWPVFALAVAVFIAVVVILILVVTK
ncbi:SERINE/THREONINE-PROTEIN KINASE PKNB [Mycoplasmopsis pulmonis]|uniref:SERINE/THREONINE-PROTEIN KINASE PKNB n=1 Tax=Mycoplasmopsis pulmonis (strain UAB CTIP) TaxID=272635 RepID=Q98PN7_MYCPU|nr:serine/threonine-protein kinase [Mycoplasmopsis pulmonis]CAC13858.1 SERINE/THREONINE-PROTEIN KINASE PKNB [Mycoplasmopsis pulmonis]